MNYTLHELSWFRFVNRVAVDRLDETHPDAYAAQALHFMVLREKLYPQSAQANW